ncbi:MAG: hypothetical protein O7H40_18590 [Gammaproteobacteria bacterium]|nr:hypothetical protein [Gammaproteobacteria bacterium]
MLFYGSCRRDGHANGVVDFYVLVDSYRALHEHRFQAWLNELVPPNVYYLELLFEDCPIRVKYSIMSLPQFLQSTARGFDPTIWVRFCQPCSIVYAREGSTAVVVGALANAARIMIAETAPLMRENFTSKEFWLSAFHETYKTEIRVERSNRAAQLYENDAVYYDRIAQNVLEESGDRLPLGRFTAATPPSRRRIARRWRVRRFVGKSLTVLRLAKAAFTFDGGIDYVLWKIERHAGVRLPITPWQRRHPLLAAPLLFWRYYRLGVFG